MFFASWDPQNFEPLPDQRVVINMTERPMHTEHAVPNTNAAYLISPKSLGQPGSPGSLSRA